MNIPQEQKTAETSRQPAPSETSKPTRYADWISYGVAVTQQTVSQASR
ncbi:hypothetical protein [Hymenobacter negativus]|jgi:hypothetical protein|uniref:Uncharacterized protein n=1 Tax=Hymenobacter negativus TaxID=2795026 RepID=A0ABS3QHF0_9BACT|nr:hypothetical protein [Hymenobacter negativus]MBO2010582.1 hypothetical protein [Hymenobacter negativus]